MSTVANLAGIRQPRRLRIVTPKCRLPSGLCYRIRVQVPLTHAPQDSARQSLLLRARRLEYLTLAWNAFEAAVALLAGILSGSIALVGFGLDSVIECASAIVVLWRVRRDSDVQCRERAERRAQQLIGVCFLFLALYVAIESLRALWTQAQPERSVA